MHVFIEELSLVVFRSLDRMTVFSVVGGMTPNTRLTLPSTVQMVEVASYVVIVFVPVVDVTVVVPVVTVSLI